ncbi:MULTISPECIES: VOC family protein [unclassified Gordonia (in: high G+C Gram-positive bacteria)]|uniref:VOC family protein n=1 Tax=unclassified Gordonia (in: high G+C Gram-positive bacteria) TaxID=2657482 RepID=UPI001F10444E|nr:VOC family protein [Gordonia sp. ABSL49_1]MCH5642746.1 extradiol dioxygenase [Gordonia sp. ABSL49_1]
MAISGAHIIVFSSDPDADREFFTDVLEYPHVDAGHGWLIFKLPPAELAVHPSDTSTAHELYLTCDDLEETTASLRARGVTLDEATDEPWGRLTGFVLPGGSKVGLYQPFHPRATELD